MTPARKAGIVDPDELLLPREVAQLFGVSIPTVNRWAHSGRLRCIRTRGGHGRYRARDVLDAWRAQPWR